MLKLLLITLFAIAATNQACQKGCLKCNEADECQICDISKLYKLNSVTCEQVTIDKCLLIDFEGTCQLCQPGSYVDNATNTCVVVETASQIENCLIYSNATSCIGCNADYYLNANACTLVDPLITNCEYYTNATECSSCKDGYLVAANYKSCVTNPGVDNCSSYSYVSCSSCEGGMVRNLNGYLAGWRLADSSSAKLAIALLIGYSMGSDNLSTQTACETALASNCATFETGLNKCTACVAGFYITDKNLCVAYPDEPIENCAKYSSVTNCTECIAAHYFKSGKCTAIPAASLKANCIKYDTTSTSIRCTECSANFFLPANECTERVKSKDNTIANCATKNLNADKCSVCNTGSRATDDGLECQSLQANCSTYQSVNKDQPLKCNKCEDTYYLKTNTVAAGDTTTPHTECLSGTVDNCSQYNAGSATNCTTCKNGFVLESGACNASNDIAGCTMYDINDKTKCDTCTNTASFNFVIDKKCSTITAPVGNCKTHSGGAVSTPTCTVCNDGYEKSGNACNQVNISNCLTTNGGNNCETCAANYGRVLLNTGCMQPLSFLTDKCHENSTKDAGNTAHVKDVTCNICKEHSYPLDFNKHYVCVNNTNLDQFHATAATSDCIKYSEAMACEQCNPAATAKYLKAGACVSGCGASNAEATFDKVKIGATDTFQIDQFNVCVDTAVTGCLVQAPDAADVTDLTPICIGATADHLPVVTVAATKYSPVDPRSNATFPYIENAFTVFPLVVPQVKTGQKIDLAANDATVAGNVQANCDYFYVDSVALVTDIFHCLKCAHGYRAPIVVNTVAANDDYLGTCVQASNVCQSTRLYNIGLENELLFSCHLCVDTNKIPFVGYKFTSSTSAVFTMFEPWGTDLSTGTAGEKFNQHPTLTNNNIECLTNVHATFGVDSTAAADSIIANCALGAVNTDSAGVTQLTTADTVALAIICVACKPGYRKATDAAESRFTCAAIANCKTTGSYANACEECSTGHILKYATNAIQFEDENACLSVSATKTTKLANCWAAEEDSSSSGTAGECAVCKKGFYLNADKFCESVTPINCKSGKYRRSDGALPANATYMLFQQGNGVGCNECEASHSAVKVVATHHICVGSDWIQSNVDSITTIADTKFIPHCKYYDATDIDSATNYTCKECDASYVIKGSGVTANGKECFAGTSLANCSIASSATQCLVCVNNTFSLVNNSCIAGNIANCAAYDYNNNQTQVKCITCSAGFYLTTDNKCLAGLIPNCKVFVNNQKDQCATCDDNHALVSVKNSGKYCYPVSDDLNCSAYTVSNNIEGGQITCSACSNPTTHLIASPTATENNTICMNFVPISNCVSYDVATTLDSSNFKCTGCAEKFYYHSDTNKCNERVNNPAKCLSYSSTLDECTSCGSNSYLFNSNKECKDYPQGILGCREYSDGVTCTACKSDRYLNENACPLADPVIDNCLYYSSKTTCSVCKSTFVLVNNVCNKANATNCLTYQSVDACASCGPNHGLETSNGVTSCIAKTKTGCANINDNSPYDCTLCNPGFYLDAGECKNPNNIDNCSVYDSADTCEMCNKNYALATDKKSCINTGVIGSQIPAGCTNASAVSTPVCSVCGPAYHFSIDNCVKLCTGDDSDGCFTCDPSTPELCFACLSGYHQNKEGKCVKDTTSGGGGGDGGGDSGAVVRSVISIFVALMVFFH